MKMYAEDWNGTVSQVPVGLGHADLANRLVPTLVPRQLLRLGGARVGRCHWLLEELALAFAMGTHGRLGSGAGAGRGGEGQGRCLYEMPVPCTAPAGGACEEGGGALWREGGRVRGGRGAADGGTADEGG